ncbi:MAG: hypothetical protein AB1938_20395 [Myxococcota bacterium]
MGRHLALSALAAVVVFALTTAVATFAFRAQFGETTGAGGLDFIVAFAGGVAAGLIASAVAFVVTLATLRARKKPPEP